jgi:hypothetical protein
MILALEIKWFIGIIKKGYGTVSTVSYTVLLKRRIRR